MPKRSWSDDKFVEVAKYSSSIAQVLRSLNLIASGSNYKIVHLTVKRLNIDVSHWTGQAHLKGKTHGWSPKIPLDNILVKDSTYTSTWYLKKRLLAEGLLEYKCSICGIKDWLAKPLVLQLDHINGDPFDHRLTNLRLLCPNCHTQTINFAGRNIGSSRVSGEMVSAEYSRYSSYGMGVRISPDALKKTCTDCSKLCSKNAERCKSCAAKLKSIKQCKISWPSITQLLTKLSNNPNYSALARDLGVTATAVRKHIKHYSALQ